MFCLFCSQPCSDCGFCDEVCHQEYNDEMNAWQEANREEYEEEGAD